MDSPGPMQAKFIYVRTFNNRISLSILLNFGNQWYNILVSVMGQIENLLHFS